MSDYTTRLTQLSERRQKLLEEEQRLIEKRKKEIGALAERFHVLTASDELLIGLFVDIQKSLEEKNTQKVTYWQQLGRSLLHSKPSKTKPTSTAQNTLTETGA
jgi:hypothetical protein